MRTIWRGEGSQGRAGRGGLLCLLACLLAPLLGGSPMLAGLPGAGQGTKKGDSPRGGMSQEVAFEPPCTPELTLLPPVFCFRQCFSQGLLGFVGLVGEPGIVGEKVSCVEGNI